MYTQYPLLDRRRTKGKGTDGRHSRHCPRFQRQRHLPPPPSIAASHQQQSRHKTFSYRTGHWSPLSPTHSNLPVLQQRKNATLSQYYLQTPGDIVTPPPPTPCPPFVLPTRLAATYPATTARHKHTAMTTMYNSASIKLSTTPQKAKSLVGRTYAFKATAQANAGETKSLHAD